MVVRYRQAARWSSVIVDLYLDLMILCARKQTHTDKLIQKELSGSRHIL